MFFPLAPSMSTPYTGNPFQAFSSGMSASGDTSPTRWRPGSPVSHNYPTLPEDALILRPLNPSHGEAHPDSTAGRAGDQPLGQYDDAPYVPPRVAQAELHAHPALHPRVVNPYQRPNHDNQHPFSYDSGTSPSESQHSIESNWSTSSSSSTSSQQLPLVDPASQYPLPPHVYPQHYPGYLGSHRVGLEHVRYGEQPQNIGGSYYRNASQPYGIFGDDVDGRVNISAQMNYQTTTSQGSASSSAMPVSTQPPNISTFSVSHDATSTTSSRSRFPDAGPYLRQQLGLSAHDPVSLQMLPDPPPGEKPTTPLPMLVKLAIYGSPNKQLTLQEIYSTLENRFQWFRDHKHDKAWKNSIRHNLSLNQVFKHVPRAITEPGKGNYWQLDVSGGEGYKRLRKRRPKNRMISSEEEEETSEMEDDRNSPAPGRSSMSAEDVNIDPGLRKEGHVVGEGRTRSSTRRAGGSPYPSQSPRHQQGPLPSADASGPGHPAVRFGQPSFGQSSFPTYPQPRPMPAATPSTSFVASSFAVAPTTSAATYQHPQHMTPYDRHTHIPQPQPPPRSGIEYVQDPEGLMTARRVRTYSESQGQSQQDATRSSPESSSGSSRTWKDGRRRSETRG